MYHIAEIEETGVCWIGLQPIASIPLLVSKSTIICIQHILIFIV